MIRIRREGRGSYVVEIHGEDHTMGTLLVEAVKQVSDPDLVYYEMAHPMEDIVTLYVRYGDDVDIRDVLKKAASYLLELNSDFRENLLEAIKKAGGSVEG